MIENNDYESEDLIRAIQLVEAGYSQTDIYTLARKMYISRTKKNIKKDEK